MKKLLILLLSSTLWFNNAFLSVQAQQEGAAPGEEQAEEVYEEPVSEEQASETVESGETETVPEGTVTEDEITALPAEETTDTDSVIEGTSGEEASSEEQVSDEFEEVAEETEQLNDTDYVFEEMNTDGDQNILNEVDTANLPEVSYIDADGSTKTCNEYTVVKNTDTTWKKGWYVVNSDVTIGAAITLDLDVEETVNLIIMDGCTLTVNSITSESGNFVTFAQSKGNSMGNLRVT